MSAKPFVFRWASLISPFTADWFQPKLWAWHCPNCKTMGYMETNRVDVFNRAATHTCPNLARTVVARLPISGNWYWECDRCNRLRILTNFQAASWDAQAHAHSAFHRYTTLRQIGAPA